MRNRAKENNNNCTLNSKPAVHLEENVATTAFTSTNIAVKCDAVNTHSGIRVEIDSEIWIGGVVYCFAPGIGNGPDDLCHDERTTWLLSRAECPGAK